MQQLTFNFAVSDDTVSIYYGCDSNDEWTCLGYMSRRNFERFRLSYAGKQYHEFLVKKLVGRKEEYDV